MNKNLESVIGIYKSKSLELLSFGKQVLWHLQKLSHEFWDGLRKIYLNAVNWFQMPWSIHSVVLRDEKDWKKFNSHRKAMALSKIERELLFSGEHPIRFSISLLALIIAIWILLQVLPEEWFLATWHDWQASEQFSHFSTLWAVQATLGALVYPIVIAFVTVFLQRRPSAEAFIHLYILDSGALVAGLSSLALVLVMGIQYFLIPTYGTQTLPMWVALDSAWFLLNAALTFYFLFRTIEFLRPEIQHGVFRRYAVSVALPRDVMRLNSFQVLAQTYDYGWIKAPSYLDDKAPDGPKVWLSRFGFREGEAQGIYHLSEPARLVNVRLFPLRLVIASWMRAATKWPKPEGKQQLSKGDWPLLNVKMTPGTIYHDSTSLATVDAGPPLSKWQQKLLQIAYVFQPIRKERYGIQVKSILQEIEADTKAAAGKPDVEAFDKAYETLVELHELLLAASLAKSDGGEIGSWALLPDITSFADRALYLGWSDTYRSIFLAAIEAMERDARPIRRLCHLVQHIESDDLQKSPVEIRENLLQLPPLMMHQLGNWWVRRLEEQGIMEHSPHRMSLLRAPLHRVYEEVVSTFVGGWENAKVAIAVIPESTKDFDWSMAPTLGRLNAFHLQETARMLLAAVARGDQAAAEWLADVLCKWWGKYSYEDEPITLYGKTQFLTFEHLSLDWAIVFDELGLTEQDLLWDGSNSVVIQRSTFLAALKNYWTDIRLLVVELLLHWASQDQSNLLNESLAMEIATGLLVGKEWRGGNQLLDSLSELTASSYLNAKVRQYAANGAWRSGYVGRLNQFIERVKDMERPDMVSSRIYSFSGPDDIDSLQEQQLILLAALSTNAWTLSETLRGQVETWLSKPDQRNIEVLRREVDEWLQRLRQQKEKTPKVLTILLNRLGKKHDAEFGQLKAEQGIESLKNHVETLRGEILAAEPIDPQRLEQIAQYASNKAFDKTTGKFPLQLFNEVKNSSNNLQEHTLRRQQVPKGELTHIEMDRRSVNEEEVWARAMTDIVGRVLLSDVLGSCNTRELIVPDAESYWMALQSEAAHLIQQGKHPILILDNATRPEWVWQWQHSDYDSKRPRPMDLSVQRFKGRGNGYICNFNDIEVYVSSLPYGKSILLPRETFNSVEFREFAPGKFVNVTVDERPESKLLVDLKLTFERQVELSDGEAIALNYMNGINPIIKPKAS